MRRTPACVLAAMVGATLSTLSCGAKTELRVSDVRIRLLRAFHDTTCAVDDHDTVYCWGGFGSRRANAPIRVGTIPSLVDLSISTNAVCALDADGTVYCAGDNVFGALGLSGPSRTHFERVTSIPPARALASAAYSHSALTRDGQWWYWGVSDELVDGMWRWEPALPFRVTVDRPILSLIDEVLCARHENDSMTCISAVRVRGGRPEAELSERRLATNTEAIYRPASDYSCTRVERDLQCRVLVDAFRFTLPEHARSPFVVVGRSNSPGVCTLVGEQLLCSPQSPDSPMRGRDSQRRRDEWIVQDLPPMREIAVGTSHVCGLGTDRRVRCWGFDDEGQFGLGAERYSSAPALLEGIENVRAIVGTVRPTVATPSIIEARVANVIEPNDTQSISRPSWLEMSSIGSFAPSQPVTHIVGSRISDKVCFQSAEGSVQCASARFPMQSEPEVTIPLGARAQALVYGHGASELFVLTTDSRVLRANFSLSPPMFEPLPQFANARAVASSGSTACAVTQDHRVLCIHERSASAMPSEIPLPPTETIIAGQDDLCAIHTDGTVSCWGNSAHFRFPDFNRRDAIVRRNVPRRVEGLRDVRTLDLDARYAACAVHTDGRVSCWGDDDVTFPDDGSPIHWSPPTVVPGVDHARSVHVLRGQACAVREDGRALCWGARSGTRERLGPIPASDRALLVPLP